MLKEFTLQKQLEMQLNFYINIQVTWMQGMHYMSYDCGLYGRMQLVENYKTELTLQKRFMYTFPFHCQ